MALARQTPTVPWYRLPTLWALIGANLLPLAGVIAFDWDVAEIVILFWLESAIIGLFHIVKLAIVAKLAALFLVPFFCVHYGGFMGVHLVFLSFFFLENPVGFAFVDLEGLFAIFARVAWAILALVASHLFSFAYFLARERPTADPSKTMSEPYARIIVMQVTIIVGAFLFFATGSSGVFLALLVVLKIAVDLASHLRQHGLWSGPWKKKDAAAPEKAS